MSKKYILSEWPESQEFIGHPDCFLITPMEEDAKQLDGALMVPESLFLEIKTNNVPVDSLQALFDQFKSQEQFLRESIRHYLSAKLMDTSDDNRMECKICLVTEIGFGLSSLNYPWIYQMWQDPCEGIIYFNYDRDGEEIVEFDYMLTEDLITICKEIDEN